MALRTLGAGPWSSVARVPRPHSRQVGACLQTRAQGPALVTPVLGYVGCRKRRPGRKARAAAPNPSASTVVGGVVWKMRRLLIGHAGVSARRWLSVCAGDLFTRLLDDMKIATTAVILARSRTDVLRELRRRQRFKAPELGDGGVERIELAEPCPPSRWRRAAAGPRRGAPGPRSSRDRAGPCSRRS